MVHLRHTDAIAMAIGSNTRQGSSSTCSLDRPRHLSVLCKPHLRALSCLLRASLSRKASDVMLPCLQLLSTFWTELQLTAVPSLLAAPSRIRRSSIVHFEPPKLRKRACAVRIRAIEPVWVTLAQRTRLRPRLLLLHEPCRLAWSGRPMAL